MNVGLKKVSWRMLAAVVVGFALVAAASYSFGAAARPTASAKPLTGRHGAIAANPQGHLSKMGTVDWSKLAKVTPSTASNLNAKAVPTGPDRMTTTQRAAYLAGLKSGKIKAPFAPAQPAPQGAQKSNVPGPNFDCNGYNLLPCVPYHFAGLNSTQAGGWYPPDQALATNTSQVMEGNNNVFALYNFSGATVYGPTSSFTFFAPVYHSGDSLGDPQMFWDTSRGHFIIVEIEFTSCGTGCTQDYVDLAVSKVTSGNLNPSIWYEYQWGANTNVGGTANWCDYPTLGSEYWGIWISCVAFSQAGSSFLGNSVFAIDKTDVYHGNVVPVLSYNDIQAGTGNAYRLSPALEDGTPDAEFLIATDASYGGPYTDLTTVAFTDTVALNSGAYPSATYVIDSLPVAYTDPINLSQPGTAVKLASGYGPKQVEYKGGNLYFAMTTAVNSGADDGVYWAEVEPQLSQLDPANPQNQTVAHTVMKQAAIWAYPSGDEAFMPSFEGSSEDDAVLVFNYVSVPNSTYPSIVYTGRRATDPLNSMGYGNSVFIIQGATPNGSGRWGDYSACSLAPNLTSRGTIFCAGEYGGPDSSATSNGWDTYIYGMRVE